MSPSTDIRAAFFGSPAFAVPFVDACIASAEIEVGAIWTQPPKPAGRGKTVQPTPVQRFADAQGIPVHISTTFDDSVAETIRDEGFDVGVLVAYGKLIPDEVIAAFPKGIVNVHPSLLPHYRGPSPVQTAIRDGAARTGVTIMLLDSGMDTGPILAREAIPLGENDTAEDVYRSVERVGAPLLVQTVVAYCTGKLVPTPQSGTPSVTTKCTRDDGAIDWSRSAEEIDRQRRAYIPWPGVWTIVDGVRLSILDGTPTSGNDAQPGTTERDNDVMRIACGNGTALEIRTVKPEGKKPMAAADWLRGHPSAVGSVARSD